MDIINIEKYPLDKGPDDPEYKECVSTLRRNLHQKGVAQCPDFLKGSALNEAVKEVLNVESKAWKTESTHNIYLDLGDSNYPMDHIRNRLIPTTVSSIAYDYLPKNGVLSRLYNNKIFVEFLRDVLEQPVLYCIEDPFGACATNVSKPGWPHGDSWHFDQSPFSTTIMLQTAEKGGKFEHTLPIRKGKVNGKAGYLTQEEKKMLDIHYEEMTKIVDGDATNLIRKLNFEPGTLNIFQGNECLHRVTPVEGNRNRMVAILCYALKPGVKNSKEIQEMFWGRSED